MFVEMIDLLRCPRPHDDAWLVAATSTTVARHVVRGTLGCPVCEAEYPIVDGVADFGAAPAANVAPGDAGDVGDPTRVAAFLGLSSPGGTIALGGAWQRVAADVMALAGVRVLLLDPLAGAAPIEGLSAVRGGGGLPVAAGALRGVVLDGRTADAARLSAAVRALAPRGRLVAPAAAPLPTGVAELARDERLWVAERDAGAPASRPVQLSRARTAGR